MISQIYPAFKAFADQVAVANDPQIPTDLRSFTNEIQLVLQDSDLSKAQKGKVLQEVSVQILRQNTLNPDIFKNAIGDAKKEKLQNNTQLQALQKREIENEGALVEELLSADETKLKETFHQYGSSEELNFAIRKIWEYGGRFKKGYFSEFLKKLFSVLTPQQMELVTKQESIWYLIGNYPHEAAEALDPQTMAVLAKNGDLDHQLNFLAPLIDKIPINDRLEEKLFALAPFVLVEEGSLEQKLYFKLEAVKRKEEIKEIVNKAKTSRREQKRTYIESKVPRKLSLNPKEIKALRAAILKAKTSQDPCFTTLKNLDLSSTKALFSSFYPQKTWSKWKIIAFFQWIYRWFLQLFEKNLRAQVVEDLLEAATIEQLELVKSDPLCQGFYTKYKEKVDRHLIKKRTPVQAQAPKREQREQHPSPPKVIPVVQRNFNTQEMDLFFQTFRNPYIEEEALCREFQQMSNDTIQAFARALTTEQDLVRYIHFESKVINQERFILDRQRRLAITLSTFTVDQIKLLAKDFKFITILKNSTDHYSQVAVNALSFEALEVIVKENRRVFYDDKLSCQGDVVEAFSELAKGLQPTTLDLFKKGKLIAEVQNLDNPAFKCFNKALVDNLQLKKVLFKKEEFEAIEAVLSKRVSSQDRV
jgi:hypothetical protein